MVEFSGRGQREREEKESLKDSTIPPEIPPHIHLPGRICLFPVCPGAGALRSLCSVGRGRERQGRDRGDPEKKQVSLSLIEGWNG